MLYFVTLSHLHIAVSFYRSIFSVCFYIEFFCFPSVVVLFSTLSTENMKMIATQKYARVTTNTHEHTHDHTHDPANTRIYPNRKDSTKAVSRCCCCCVWNVGKIKRCHLYEMKNSKKKKKKKTNVWLAFPLHSIRIISSDLLAICFHSHFHSATDANVRLIPIGRNERRESVFFFQVACMRQFCLNLDYS